MIFVMTILLGFLVNLIISHSRNMKLLFDNQTRVLDRVSRGDLFEMAPVATSDEFGFIAGYTNDMIAGLRHRTRLIAALKVAEEIQQTLLPADAPAFSGADLAGKSLWGMRFWPASTRSEERPTWKTTSPSSCSN